jgi:hypothetical protein
VDEMKNGLSPKSTKLAKNIKALDTPKRNFIENQVENANRKPTGRRYTAETTELAMSLYAGNPRTLENVKRNNQIILPSGKHLSRIKNTVKQTAGVNEPNLEWMRLIANEEGRPLSDFYGGLLIDEMKVQEDIELSNTKNGSILTGLAKCKEELTLASHVLQFLYVGFGGFTFPVAHYPTVNLDHTELYDYFWNVTTALYRKGFKVKYCMLDGASTNRAFINLQITSPVHPITTNILDHSDLIFIQDPSHVLKKIRNSILNSGKGKNKTREMQLDGHTVVWDQWVNAYLWDQREHPGFPINAKLSDSHMFPCDCEKMRNHLAFDCLNYDMLHLMKEYQRSLKNGIILDGAVKLLEKTASLVNFFCDGKPVTDKDDERIKNLLSVGSWFQEWEQQHETNNRLLLAPQTREDIKIMVNGIVALTNAFVDFDIPFIPDKANSDIIENFFCQQRGIYHGANSHPTYSQYCTAINSIILSQHSLSKKSNVGHSQGKTCYSAAAKVALQNVQKNVN